MVSRDCDEGDVSFGQYNFPEESVGLRSPHVALHGSFSLMVNFDAVAIWTRLREGLALLSPFHDGFKVTGVFSALSFLLTDVFFFERWRCLPWAVSAL